MYLRLSGSTGFMNESDVGEITWLVEDVNVYSWKFLSAGKLEWSVKSAPLVKFESLPIAVIVLKLLSVSPIETYSDNTVFIDSNITVNLHWGIIYKTFLELLDVLQFLG